MEEKKVLSIDTMICDLRTVSEETLQSYEKIYISAMTVFISEMVSIKSQTRSRLGTPPI